MKAPAFAMVKLSKVFPFFQKINKKVFFWKLENFSYRSWSSNSWHRWYETGYKPATIVLKPESLD
jgi:hypothetical protein